MKKNPIEEAESFFIRRKWYEVIRLLEPLEPVYRDNKRFLFLLGTSFLYLEDIGSAYSSFRKAQQADFRDKSILIGLSAVFVRRGEFDKAIQLYIEILERDSNHRGARRGLSFLRVFSKNVKDNETSSDIKRIRKNIYPRPPFNKRLLLVFFLLAASLTLGFCVFPGVVKNLYQKTDRPGISAVSLSPEDLENPVNTQGSFTIVLTQQESLSAFNKAKSLFFEYRDEAALVELNRLLLSNTQGSIKTKAKILSRYAREPSFITMPDRFSYKDVSAFPELYEGVAVIWKGMPANIVAGAGSTRFDLLVGYQNTKNLEGIVEVTLPFDFTLKESGAIEVLARVRNNSSATIGFSLECTAIHELLK